MSLDPLWMESLQKAATKHFSAQEIGVPWDFDDSLEVSRVSLSFKSFTAEKINQEEYLASFSISAVCTITSKGLYDISYLSGKVSSLLLGSINSDYACIEPVSSKVEIKLFDFAHGHEQSLMVQKYTSRLRG